MIGYGKIFIRLADQTEAHIAEALRLSPRDTLAYIWMSVAGDAKNHLGSWEQAVEWFRRAIEANRNYPNSRFQLAGALRRSWSTGRGRIPPSGPASRSTRPSLIARARAARTARSDNPNASFVQLERILEGWASLESRNNDCGPPPRGGPGRRQSCA